MHDTSAKPKLVFFQRRYTDDLPPFLRIQAAEQVKCLEESFEVALINQDCDYRKICDEYQPDLALFETGVNVLRCRRLKITGTRALSGVPRLGLVNADAWCETRSATISEMEEWGLEALFSISTTAIEHTPALADALFIWPVFVDTQVFRDYHRPKLIPVLLTGSTAPQYPWRNRVYRLIANRYPSLICPHHGYLTNAGPGQMLYGERYAKTINASLVVPACGTVAREVVRKHFEVPACNSCLISERSPGLEAAGFKDMKNCVFADEHDVLDKLDYLFRRPEEMQEITRAGHDLVCTRHTLKQRDQVAQWFRLHTSLRPGEKIIQNGPFGPLSAVPDSAGLRTSYVCGGGPHLRLIREGDRELRAGQYQRARRCYLSSLGYMNLLPEARLKIAMCDLYMGNAAEADRRLFELVEYSLAEYNAADPDPVEWAYYIVGLLCRGRVTQARDRAAMFPALHHQELNRVRIAVAELSGTKLGESPSERTRASLHERPTRSMQTWTNEICMMLKACGQERLLVHLEKALSEDQPRISEPNVRSAEVSKESSRRQPASTVSRAFQREIAYHKIHRHLTRSIKKTIASIATLRRSLPGTHLQI